VRTIEHPNRIRIAIIGGGSVVFGQTLIGDILAGATKAVDFTLMAPTTVRTSATAAWAESLIHAEGLPATVSVVTDQREAVRHADYVIATFNIGGLRATECDYEIPMRHGVDQCVGDTLGPGGIFRAQRAIPVATQLARDISELCPRAVLLNYVNPMAMIGWALGGSPVTAVGLCHGVQVSLDLIAAYTGVPKQEIEYLSAGINHMAWFLRLQHRGINLYPLLRERFEHPEYYANEKVRGELFRHFGYFMTESTAHLSEYLPYFRKSAAALNDYCDEPGSGAETGAEVRWSRMVAESRQDLELMDANATLGEPTSEYGPRIIEAIETGKQFHFQGNVINRAMIVNLPPDCCVEGPMIADGSGLHQVIVGELPSHLAALNLTNINVQRLAVEAAVDGDPEALVHACALDPLTSAVLTLREIREMAAEMLDAQREWLPQFAGQRIRTLPSIPIPEGTRRAEVPLDPSLTVAARFGQLAEIDGKAG
jgi:alpha-galactosidase